MISSSFWPEKFGTRSCTRADRASTPSVLSMTTAANNQRKAPRILRAAAACIARNASTAPDAVYECTSHAGHVASLPVLASFCTNPRTTSAYTYAPPASAHHVESNRRVLERHIELVHFDRQRYRNIERCDRRAGVAPLQVEPYAVSGELDRVVHERRVKLPGKLGAIALKQILNHRRDEFADGSWLLVDDVPGQLARKCGVPRV